MVANDRERPQFSRDLNREASVADFLDGKLYPNFFDSWSRVSDREMQLSGVDVICKHPEVKDEMFVDEKAATSWANREISTFAFELSFLLGQSEIEGWFLSSGGKSRTTHWLCIWPRTSGGQIHTVEDIVSAEVMLIETRALRNWVRKMAVKSEISLEECIRSLRKSETENEIHWAGLRVIISRKLPEQPVNLLIPKDVLFALSHDNNWRLN